VVISHRRRVSAVYDDDRIAGNWTDLLDRIDSGSLRSWAMREPALSGFGTAAQLSAGLERGCELDSADRVLVALLRLAHQKGGRDDDALLLLLHLMSGWVYRLAAQMADLSEESMGLVVAELTLQIRDGRVVARRRAYAENLKWETRRAVLADLRPAVRNHPEWQAVPVDPHSPAWGRLLRPDPGEAQELDLLELVAWAANRGVIRGSDLELLILTLEESRRGKSARDAELARRLHVTERTVRRWRARATLQLRAARPLFLEQAA
jgi:hypothetical protein